MASKVIHSCDRCSVEVEGRRQLFVILVRHSDGSEVIGITGEETDPELCGKCVAIVTERVREDWPDAASISPDTTAL